MSISAMLSSVGLSEDTSFASDLLESISSAAPEPSEVSGVLAISTSGVSLTLVSDADTNAAESLSDGASCSEIVSGGSAETDGCVWSSDSFTSTSSLAISGLFSCF